MSETTRSSLGNWPFSLELRVAWGEMDAFQHLNNVQYVRYIESARIAYFDALKIPLMPSGAGPILASQTIHYRKPIVYPDIVHVETTTTKIGTTSIVNAYRIISDKVGLAAEAESTCVWYDYPTATKAPVPDDLRAAIYRLEASTT